jgi:hypothetical protein
MPDKKTLERAARDKREGKAPSTQAGEFVREEIEHIREGKHGARARASDRNRPVESAARWCRPAATEKRIHVRTNAAQCETGL